MSFGYVVAQNLGGGGYYQYLLVMAVLLAAAFVAWTPGGRRAMTVDNIFVACVLLVSLGYLLSQVPSVPTNASALLLSLGAQGFYGLFLAIFAIVGSRNSTGAFVTACQALSVSTIGSAAGLMLNEVSAWLAARGVPDITLLCSLALAYVLLVYTLYAMRDFRFAVFFEEITEAEDVVVPDGVPAQAVEGQPAAGQAEAVPTIDESLGRLCDAAGLTPREREIAGLLARGHSGQAIQDRLTISRNTAKTHTRHVYQKLGVHSQQELIDLIEGGRRRLGSVNN